MRCATFNAAIKSRSTNKIVRRLICIKLDFQLDTTWPEVMVFIWTSLVMEN